MANYIGYPYVDDTLIGGSGKDSIYGDSGNDTLNGNGGKDTLRGGEDDDELTGGKGADIFAYNVGDGDDIITDYEEADKLRIESGTITITQPVGSTDVIFKITSGQTKGTITVKGGKGKIITYIDPNGNEQTYPGPDIIPTSKGATLLADYNGNEFDVTSTDKISSDYRKSIVTIDASQVEHDLNITGNAKANKIIGTSHDDYIYGGTGKVADTIDGGDGNDTIEGGKGNDILTGGAGDDVFLYNKGDGNDKILDYTSGDVIQLGAGLSIKNAKKSGADYIFTIGDSKITVAGGADKYVHFVDAAGNDIWYPVPPPTPIVISGKKKVTLTESYFESEFDVTNDDRVSNVASSVVSIDASEVQHDLNITGNKLANNIIGTELDDEINGAAGADTINGGDGNDTINGGKGNDKLYGGDGADVFLYNKGDGDDKILDYESEDTIQLGAGVTIKKAKKSGNNYIFTTSSGTISVIGGAGKYIHFVDATGADNWYPVPPIDPINPTGKKKVELTETYFDSEFDVNTDDRVSDIADSVITIDASAVQHDLFITGNKKANVITGTSQDDYLYGKAGADTIYGGDGADTINGGTGDDKLYGGDGADLFFYKKGDGNDKIYDYESEDIIEISGDYVKDITQSKKNNDIVFTLNSKNKITVVGGAGKVISYIDSKNPDPGTTYPIDTGRVVYNEDHTSATLTANYSKSSFTSSDYSAYVSDLVTIDASKVTHEIKLGGSDLENNILGSSHDDYIDGGNGKDTLYGNDGDDTILGGIGNDKIYGGDGNDSLWGGKGTDSLWGGDGEDIFMYSNGDGKNIIMDYEQGIDTIMVTSGKVALKSTTNDVIFNVGDSGQIVVKNASNKYVEVVDTSNNRLAYYNPYSR